MCPKLVLASNSGKVKLVNEPVKGIDGPTPFIWIEYLPATIQNILELIIMDAILADHTAVCGTTDIIISLFIFFSNQAKLVCR
jgi:hypothetical protein